MNTRYSLLLNGVGGAGITGLLLGSASAWGGSPVPTLPVPCSVTATCTSYNFATGKPTSTNSFVTAGSATASTSGNTLTINQSSQQAILNWSSFNVGVGGSVVFRQPSTTSIALNKIYQASPSSIFGAVTANGQLYLMNPNGFLFAKGSSVNVGGLVASSLGLSQGDGELANGILSPIAAQAPALSSDGRTVVTDGAGNPVLDANGNPQTVQVAVQAGASITASSGGRILLAGQNVANAGALSAPSGQVGLAAGTSVYLQASADPLLRGLVIEVDGANGTVTNAAGGSISAAHGNVSLVGMAVNQSGRISASTAISGNGSVILTAASGAQFNSCPGLQSLCANTGGTLTLGSSSDIELTPDTTDTTTAVAAQAQQQSQVQLIGKQIFMQGGKIIAPDGVLTAVAADDPSGASSTSTDPNAQIRVDSGSSIDLSGSVANLPMSSNLLSIQLFANELADDPDQRNGALHGQTVIVDTRQGQPAIISSAAWDAALGDVQQSILQRTSAGGTASFSSAGDVVFNSGATLNVSGGAWNYAAGVVQTSELIGANGHLYNIGSANPALTYTGVVNPAFTQTYNNWGVQITQSTPGFASYQSGYAQGSNAGTVMFSAPSLAIAGSLKGSAINGPYQRSPSTAALGGTLVIGDSQPAGVNGYPEFAAPAVTFAASAPTVTVADGTALAPGTLMLPVSYLSSGGFEVTNIFSDSSVTLPVGLPLNLGPGGVLSVTAPHIAIGANIVAPDGNLNFQVAQTVPNLASGDSQRLGIAIGDGVTLDVRGTWTNDTQGGTSQLTQPAFVNGGAINLSTTAAASSSTSGALLSVGNDVSLEASGGAWMQAGGTTIGGKGGSITLDASAYQSGIQIGRNVALDAFGVNGAAGGSFNLLAPRITIASGGQWAAAQTADALKSDDAVLQLGAGLFANDGFSTVNLQAVQPQALNVPVTDSLVVDANTVINAQASSWLLNPRAFLAASGGDVAGLVRTGLLPASSGSPYSLTLGVATALTGPSEFQVGTLDVQNGASIVAPAAGNKGSSINLVGQGSIRVDGSLSAPGGSINATITGIKSLTGSTTAIDPGYIATQGIDVGPTGSLNAQGTVIATPNAQGLQTGTVLPGGTVSLVANRGSVTLESGSSVNISGTQANLAGLGTVGAGYQSTLIGSAGGILNVDARQSASLLGSLSAAAGSNGDGPLAGGTLNLNLGLGQFGSQASGGAGSGYTQSFPAAPPTIQLVSTTAGNVPSASIADTALLGIAQLQQSGIGSLNLQADNVIQFNTSQPLSLGQSVSLNAPVLAVVPGVSASLSAPYVAITDTTNLSGSVAVASTGSGALTINAQEISLAGNTTLQGVGNATLNASADVQFLPAVVGPLPSVASGGNSAVTPPDQLNLDGNLTVNASRVFPSTYVWYTINDADASGKRAGTVSFGQVGTSPGTPLSANGSLTVNAANIISGGTVLAPFGNIAFNASQSLDLKAGSLTSVSGAGLTIPFGQTSLGQLEWIFNSGNASAQVTGVPTKQVALNAPSVTLAKGATVDISGGGDLSAYEWVPGTGGYVNSLSTATATTAGLYAILPSTLGLYSAYNVQDFAAPGATQGTFPNVAVGSDVFLSGVSGLKSGLYPLLPASYALLPGAYLIQVQPSVRSQSSGILGTTADGAPVVAGYFTLGGTGVRSGSSGYTGFAVWPGSRGQALAAYDVTTASNFFSANTGGTTTATLPANAGSLLISAGNALSALGTVNSAGAAGGTAATIDVSATDLTVTGGASQGAPGTVTVQASVLSSWNAGDLVLGGQLSADGSSLQVDANTVTIAQGANLVAGQVLAVAGKSVEVQSGGSLSSTSGASGTAPSTLPSAVSLTLSNTNAALLGVSDTSLPIVQRSGSNGTGTVAIDAGASVNTRGAVSIDAPGGVTLAGTVNASGAAWSLASNSIGLGGSTSSDTLNVSAAQLAQMQSAGSVRLASNGSLDLLAPVNFGSASLSALTLQAAELNNGGASSFTAKTISLLGAGTAGDTNQIAPTAGNGSLTFNAGQMVIGAGNVLLNGNANTSIQSSAGVTGQGRGTAGFSGNVSIAAADLTSASGASTLLWAPNGNVQISQNGSAPTAASLASSLGGSMTVAANQIADSGSIIIPSGVIALRSPGDISLAGSTQINAAGIQVNVLNQTLGAAGGNVSIQSGSNVSLAAGTNVSVAGALGAPAGSIAIAGSGTVVFQGSLGGSASGGATGGSLSVQAGQLQGGLASLLPQLGGNAGDFSNQVNVRVGSGNLDVAAGQTITANQVTLTADQGQVTVEGTISAPSATTRGQIGLFAGTGLALNNGAQLLAEGDAANGNGGQIELSTMAGQLSLAAGSTINTAGPAQNGSLELRAPANPSGAAVGSVGISTVGSTLTGVSQVTVVPVLPTFSTDITSNFAPVASAVATYMSGATTQVPRQLGLASGTPLLIEPGVVVQTTGNLTLAQSLDLFDAQTAQGGTLPGPIDLTVRAGGNLSVNGSISDGMSLTGLALGSAPSSNITLVAGADLASANSLATHTGSAGSLTVGPGALVTTGTGNINLAAAGNVTVGAGAAVFTTGLLADAGKKITGTPVLPVYADDGGSVNVAAGQDIIGTPVQAGVSQWQAALVRNGTLASTGAPGSLGGWGINLNAYQQTPWSLLTMGGGDLNVSAGRDITTLSAGAADSMFVSKSPAGVINQTLIASGGVEIAAGRNIAGSQFLVADGIGVLRAGGSFTTAQITPNGVPTAAVGSSLALENSSVALWSGGSVAIEGIVNPTALYEPLLPTNIAQFYTYGANSSLSIQANSGVLSAQAAGPNLAYLVGSDVSQPTLSGGLGTLPASLSLVNVTGSIDNSGGSFAVLYPSATGKLTLVAGQDILGAQLAMADVPLNSFATAQAPAAGNILLPVNTVFPPRSGAFSGDLHQGTDVPATVVAGNDIGTYDYVDAFGHSNLIGTDLQLPVPGQVAAGRDVVNLTYYGQNLNPTDFTSITAGRDFIDPLVIQSNGNASASGLVSVGGPGALDILAGRNINLGFSDGVVTVGNVDDPNLPYANGAAITMMAGAQSAQDAAFLKSIVVPSPSYQSQLVSFVESLNNQTGLSTAQADAEFGQLGALQQRSFIDTVFFQELNASGLQATKSPLIGYTQGYKAIATLFPGSPQGTKTANAYSGDIDLAYSQIYSDAGGSVTLLIPGGGINAGLANPPPSLQTKPASSLGIVAQGEGDLSIYAANSINVNASRIFTLGGGNILIWSQEGNIDAGNGAKTSLSLPPPVFTFDSKGNVQLVFDAGVAGSGIRTIQSSAEVPAGNVDLIAPTGIVNAGDAGIGAAGNINIAAVSVVGASNINFGGAATGVPAAVGSLSASVSGAASSASSSSAAASAAADSAAAAREAATPLAQTAMSWLEVFVTGLGEENCRPDDTDCLKRQKSN